MSTVLAGSFTSNKRVEVSTTETQQLRAENLLPKERCTNLEQGIHVNKNCPDSMVLDKLCNFFGDDDDLGPPPPVTRLNSGSSVNSLWLPHIEGLDDEDESFSLPPLVTRLNSGSSVNSLWLPHIEGLDDMNLPFEEFPFDMNDLPGCSRSLSAGWQAIGSPRSVSLVAPCGNEGDVDTENRDSNIEVCQEPIVHDSIKKEKIDCIGQQSDVDGKIKKRKVLASRANPPFDSMEYLPIDPKEIVGNSPLATPPPAFQLQDVSPPSSHPSPSVPPMSSSVSTVSSNSSPAPSLSSLPMPPCSGKLVSPAPISADHRQQVATIKREPDEEKLVSSAPISSDHRQPMAVFKREPDEEKPKVPSSENLMATPNRKRDKENGWWDIVLTPEQSKKHQDWPATKARRVKYGRKYVYENKRNIAISRKRKDGKFEPTTGKTNTPVKRRKRASFKAVGKK